MITQIIGHELDESQNSEAASEKFGDIQTVLVGMDQGTSAGQAAAQAVAEGYISQDSQKALEGVINCILALGGASDLTDSSGNPVNRTEDLKETSIGGFDLKVLLGLSSENNSGDSSGGNGEG